MGRKRKWTKGSRASYAHSSIIQYDDDVKAEVDLLFQKKFTYDFKDNWTLPKCQPFQSDTWEDATLTELKKRLNYVKSSLSDVDITKWHEHTQRTNRAGQVMHHIRYHCRPELCTQAWCKFHEIVAQYPLIPENGSVFNSLHLCEAPGAFITSLNHCLFNNGFSGHWNWIGNTLNPYYEGNNLSEMIDDDRLIIDTSDNWHFGADNTGNIMNHSYLSDLQKTVSGTKPLHLVTADGSVDCQNRPDEQESITAHLHFCETVLALNVLTPGGSLLLKMFTMFEQQSICLLYLLNTAFDKVTVIKPATSKPGNSEVYVVCLGYQEIDEDFLRSLSSFIGSHKQNTALFAKDLLPASFLEQHYKCSEFFTNHQIETIEENKRLFASFSADTNQRIQLVKDCFATNFQQRFNIKRLKTERYVVPHFETIGPCKQQRLSSQRAKGRHIGSYNARVDYNNLTMLEKIHNLKKYTTEESVIHWFSSPYTLEDSDCCTWKIIQGKPLHCIKYSKFCSSDILKEYNELCDAEAVLNKSTAEKSTKQGYERTISLDTCDSPVKSKSVSASVYRELWEEIESFDGEFCLMSDRANSALHDFISARVEEETTSETSENGERRNIHIVNSFIELSNLEGWIPSKTIRTILNTFKKTNKGDHLLFTINNCFTRFSAGIVYIMYSTFSKIGTFVDANDNVRWFAALNHTGCPPKLLSHLNKVLEAVDEDTPSRTVLQFVSIQNLLESNFLAMLRTANNIDLKTSINDLLGRCNKLLDQK